MLNQPKKVHYEPIPSDIEHVGKIVLDSAYKVHTTLGPGLLESVYEACLAYELRQSRSLVETQVAVPVVYADVRVDAGLRLDILIEKCVIVEIKAIEKTTPLHEAQLLTYLKISGLRLGFLINFNVLHLKDGIKRLVR